MSDIEIYIEIPCHHKKEIILDERVRKVIKTDVAFAVEFEGWLAL